MQTGNIVKVLLIAASLLITGAGWAAKPRIVILATGGTIAGAQAEGQDAGYKSGSFKVEDLIKAVPNLGELAEITGEQVVNIGSQDMNNEVWLKLAKRLNEVLAQRDVDAVVITHGTDTMEETGYFLSLVTRSRKPVVMVGSMRPATGTSADGPANIYNAVSVAAHPKAGGRGVMVLLNDEFHYAREATKTNTTQLDTFKSPNRGKAGMTNAGRVYFYDALATKHTTASVFSVDGLSELPRVEVVYAYANVGRDFIDHCVAIGCKGIVLAGVGDGNATQTAVAGLQDAIKQGVAVVRSSRTNSGITDRNVELNDDEMGSIASMELNPQKARVLLMLGLTKTRDAKKLQEFFYEY
jgi:L-asparaginase